MANILLIYPSPDNLKDWRFGFSLNLLYLATILKQVGHAVILKDYSIENFELNELAELLKTIDVVIIEFDSFPLKRALNIYNGENIAEYIKRNNRKIQTIAVGNDCILLPRAIPNIDIVINHEAEPSIVYVIDCLLNDKQVVTDLLKDRDNNLDDLPFPDRSILSSYAEHGGTIKRKPNLAKSTLIQTSRGCMNTCRFCQRKGWLGQYREHSIEYVIKEFKEIAANKYTNIWICDDNFTFNLKRAKNILHSLKTERISEGMKLALSSWANIDFDFIDIAKKANVSVISMGIESVNHDILHFYRKKIDPARAAELIQYADEIGIYTVGNFILGAPMETERTINECFEYAIKVPFDQVNIKILDYMIGADLYDELPEKLKTAERHVFACKETGLNDLPLSYLKEIIFHFRKEFDINRRQHLFEKIKSYDYPYKMELFND